jgi:hypothetical protein
MKEARKVNFQWKSHDLKRGKPKIWKVKVTAALTEAWNEHSITAE